jgi:NAD(P)H-hydrate epimerase
MTLLVTPDEMSAAEARVIASGTPASDLMLRAAQSIASWIDDRLTHPPHRTPVAVALVGPGNNGGDALVTLALLVERGWRCLALPLQRDTFGDLPASATVLARVDMGTVADLQKADVILDGIFGFRSRASLPLEIAAAISDAHDQHTNRGIPLVAIDVPSGVNAGTGQAADSAFRADVTLCLGLPKIGMIREPAATHVGELVLLDIGIPPLPGSAGPQLLAADDVRPLLPSRSASAHKHTTGSVVIVGGAPTYYGAPRLSAEAALRVGAGLVGVAVPASIVPVIAAQVPEAVFVPLDDSDGEIAAQQVATFVTERASILRAAIIGPGLGRSSRATALLDQLIGSHTSSNNASRSIANLPLVIDADALNWLSDCEDLRETVHPLSAVLTPHPGELARLLKLDVADVSRDPIASGIEAAARFQQVVVVKTGYAPVVSPSGDVWIAPRATPELATAGTGDVLAGIIGGLLAQGLSPFDAARAGVYVGGMAGRDARDEFGTLAVVASDVIRHLAGSLRWLSEPRWGL